MNEAQEEALKAMQPKDEEQFQLPDLLEEVSTTLIKDRKQELSNKVKKLFHKIDNLSAQRRKQRSDLKKTEDRLNKALDLAAKLRSGDWSVVQQLDKLDE